MTIDAAFLDEVRERLAPFGDVTSRKMFGGVGFWERGVMFALMDSRSRLYFKTDESTRPRYEAEGAEAFAPPMGDRPAMAMPYHRVPKVVWDDDAAFAQWAGEAIAVGHATATRKRRKTRPTANLPREN